MAVNGKQDMTNALNSPSQVSSATPGPNDVAAFAGPGSAFQNFFDRKYNYRATMNPEQQRILAKQKSLEGGLPELSYGTMFPSANTPILKGTYGGSAIGNVPIFAPSMLTPFGVFDARQRAMADAAAKKAEEIDAFYKMAAPPQTKRVAVQGELNDQFYRGLQMWQDNAKAAYGDDWTTALRNDVGFNGWLNSMGTVARYEDSIVDQVAALQELENDPDLVLSQEALDASAAFMNGIGGLSNPLDPAGHNLGSYLMSARAETNLDVAVNDAVKQFANDTASSMGKYGEEGVYDVWAEWSTKGMTDAQVEIIAAGIMKDQYGGDSKIFEIEDIENRVRALYPRVTQTKLAATPSTRQPASSSGATRTYDPAIITTGRKINTSSTPTGAGGISSTTSLGGLVHDDIPTKITEGMKVVDNETGKPSTLAVGDDVVWGETQIVPTTLNGVVIPDNEVEWYQKNAPNSIKYSVVTFGTYQAPPAVQGAAPVKKTVYTQSKDIKSALVTKEDGGKTQLGVPVAELQAKADELNKKYIYVIDQNGKQVKTIDLGANVQEGKIQEGYKSAGEKPVSSQNTQSGEQPKDNESKGKGVQAPYFTNPTEEQYNSLPPGAKYMYNGVEYTKQ